ncbi:TPA: Rha family transcriptional regulator [Klebsiella oxytoca]|nr:Rha family transcriptional regulator [Klebsiella oxytoca]HBL6911822.1 Rha family transcriptional regulator [Klebsiella oxytoca]
MKELGITSAASMTSLEIAELVGSRHTDVKRSIDRLAKSGVIAGAPMAFLEKINGLGIAVKVAVYKFEGEQGKRDSIVVVAQLSPEFTARLVDRWQELEKSVSAPVVPLTYKEALLHLVAKEEENERLTEKNEALDEALSVARPKAILMDRLAGTAEQLYGINEAGRILGTSGAVMASCMDMVGNVFAKRKYSTTPRQFVKSFIDRECGRNVTSIGGGHIQAKFTFKGLCFIALLLIKRGIIKVDSISYDACRDRVKEMTSVKVVA